MHRVATLLFLTLVSFGTSGYCATSEPSPDFRDRQTEDQAKSVDPTKVQLTSPTVLPPLPRDVIHRGAPYFYRYRKDFSMTATGLFGTDLEDHSGPHFLAGMQHQFSDRHLRSFEATGEIVSNQTGLLSFARRWNHSRSGVRPFHKVGLSLVIDPEDQLTTLLRLSHYLLRLGGGIECSVDGSFSFRLEAVGLAGAKSQQFGVAAVSVWGF